jgi:hypothetical protein
VISFLMFSCVPKKNDEAIARQDPKKTIQPEVEKKADDDFKKISKYIRFAASIDREILKTIRPNLSLAMTQFEVIGTILDQRQGIKKNFAAIDCKLYQIEKKLDQIYFYKQCQNPKSLIAQIDLKSERKIKITFYTKEWSGQIGASVALTAADRVCDLTADLQDKLIRMQCENTSLELGKDASEIQELRLTDYIFDQKASDQVYIQGGFYKNLVMHRKLQLNIPFDGKIKIIEKELKVRDDFIEAARPEIEPLQIKPEDNSDGKKDNQESSEKSIEKSDQKGHQKSDQESDPKEEFKEGGSENADHEKDDNRN